MLTKDKIIDVPLEKRLDLERYGVKRIGIFGSFVRNEQGPDSDIDFWVEYEPGKKSFQNYMQLAFWLEDTFQRKIDLITPESISRHIAPYVEKELEYVPLSA